MPYRSHLMLLIIICSTDTYLLKTMTFFIIVIAFTSAVKNNAFFTYYDAKTRRNKPRVVCGDLFSLRKKALQL